MCRCFALGIPSQQDSYRHASGATCTWTKSPLTISLPRLPGRLASLLLKESLCHGGTFFALINRGLWISYHALHGPRGQRRLGICAKGFLARPSCLVSFLSMASPKAYHLSTGWQCKRVCHICTGKEWENPTDGAAWCNEGCGPSPFKDNVPPSPFLDIPGCARPQNMTLDYCHAFHLGNGQDMASSTVVLLCLLGHYGPGRGLDKFLSRAFAKYISWCHKNHKVTSITTFSKQAFDMTGTCLVGKLRGSIFDIACLDFAGWVELRAGSSKFPTSLGGKAYDAAICLAWLECEMDDVQPSVACLFYELLSLF